MHGKIQLLCSLSLSAITLQSTPVLKPFFPPPLPLPFSTRAAAVAFSGTLLDPALSVRFSVGAAEETLAALGAVLFVLYVSSSLALALRLISSK